MWCIWVLTGGSQTDVCDVEVSKHMWYIYLLTGESQTDVCDVEVS